MYYTVYKITNLINEKIYVGVHKTNDLNDDYMGSGKLIKRAIEKYGIENFEKEYLEIFDNVEDMFNMESELVNEDFVKDNNTYNLKEGGEGGFDFINSSYTGTEKHLNQCLDNLEKFRHLGPEKVKELSKDFEWLEKHSNRIKKGLKKFYDEGGSNGFKGKTHSKEFKQKLGRINSQKQKGEGNSQFGTMWIHSLTEKVSKKIKKEEFPDYENQGWLKGRKMKF